MSSVRGGHRALPKPWNIGRSSTPGCRKTSLSPFSSPTWNVDRRPRKELSPRGLEKLHMDNTEPTFQDDRYMGTYTSSASAPMMIVAVVCN
jgi:hypothetical protein